MLFVDTAATFSSVVTVRNISRNGERVDAKSAMQMMLLEGTQGCILGLEADGSDAQEAVEALAKLVESGFQVD